jgi:diguanylate cyclase (GGDEF)-like protein/PAS domain S-box-containing protein
MMAASQLSVVAGEFLSARDESAFRAARFPEALRQARILLILSIVLNTLFLASDWRFAGSQHFYLAVPARLIVVAVSVLCFALLRRTRTQAGFQVVLGAWQLVTAVAVAVLASSHSEIALFVVLLLPLIYYLAVPVPFRHSLVAGIGCSALMLVGFIGPQWSASTALGLVLAVVVLNSALLLVVVHTNRLSRQEWAATESERAANARLRENRQALERMFMAVPIPLLVTDREGRAYNANLAATNLLGPKVADGAAGFLDGIYLNPRHWDAFLQALTESGTVSEYETTIRAADGSTRQVLLAGNTLSVGGQPSFITSIFDITVRKAMENDLERLATTDPLTGLANRSQFLSVAGREIERVRQSGGTLAIILLDVDEFKQINDALGHDAGDVILRAVADRLRASVRKSDLVARLGGDEFAIVLPDIGNELALERVFDTIFAKLREPLVCHGRLVECRSSMGVSIYPQHADTIETLLKDADIALYVAKTQGRGHVRRFTPDMRSIIESRTESLRMARAALEEDRIRPHYQPKVDLKSGRISGFEALLRWRDGDGRMRSPHGLAPAFEDFDLAVMLGDRMFDYVIQDMRMWIDQGIDFGHVGINFSAAEFRRDDLAERILERLRMAGVPPSRLEIEVTETVFLGRGTANVERTLLTLSNAGVRIALDDFGTGYASLSHLKQFPVDVIKIDRSFIANVTATANDTAIVHAVLGLGHSLGIEIVAEGIETEAQALYLRHEGCDYGQGFLYSEAVSSLEVPAVIQRYSTGRTPRLMTQAG